MYMNTENETYTDLTGQKKILYVEILRIIGIVFVIFNHTNYLGYVYFLSFDAGTFPYWFYMVFTVLAKISVPIFFMISGKLLLGKTETIGFVWKKRISKQIIILLVFSLIFYILDIIRFQREFSVKQFLISVYSEGIIIPYWFLYAYLSFLIILPFVRKLARDINEKEFAYLLAIYFVFVTLVEILQYRLSGGTVVHNSSLNPAEICSLIIFYPVIGYYLGTRLAKVTNKMLIISGCMAVISVISTMLITNYNLTLTGDFSEETVNVFINCATPFHTIFVFLLVRKLFEHKRCPALIGKAVTLAGSCVFGIYLIEHAYREGLYFIYFSLSEKINNFIAIWLYVLLIFLICMLQVAAFKYVVAIISKNIFKSKQQ